MVGTDPWTPGLQPDCRVVVASPVLDATGARVSFEESAAIPSCPDGAIDGAVNALCWQAAPAGASCPSHTAVVIQLVRPAADIAAGYAAGTQLRAECKTGSGRAMP